MSLSRRAFLGGVSAAAVVAAIPTPIPALAPIDQLLADLNAEGLLVKIDSLWAFTGQTMFRLSNVENILSWEVVDSGEWRAA